MFEVGGIVGIISLVLFIYATLKIVGSDASTGVKVLWIALIFFLPILGFIIWLLMGPTS
ncbi:MAG: PLD nuclease N-terminal domain-containing protein [Rhodospirillales bacterium]